MSTYVLTITIRVTDPAALLAAATSHYINENDGQQPEGFTDEDGEPIISACLIQLFDPGISPNGCEILDSACE